jgi:phosphoglycolate phosphatase
MIDKSLVIFDFDGVLANTTDFGYLATKKYNPHITKEWFDALDHGNFLENYFKAVEVGEIVDTQEGDWDEQYLEHLLSLNTHEVLKKMVTEISKHHVLAIASSTTSSHIDTFLKQEGIREFFAEILGSDVHRYKDVKIKKLLEDNAVSPERAIFITDTLGDIRAGKTCGIQAIGVTWGAHDKETLLSGEPFDVVDDVMHLEEAIYRFFA